MNFNRQHYFEQFKNLKVISLVVALSVLSSLFSLVIPLSVQILVNYMIFGRMLYPIVFLSIMIFIIFLVYGLINLFQEFIIEVFQQRLFVDFSLDFAKKINHFKSSFFKHHNSSEMINKFFEITNIQKTYSALLIYGTTLMFQMIIGLLLLASYHPYFIVYDVFLLLSLYGSIKILMNPALENAVLLCHQKHQVGAWIESIAQNFQFFKFSQVIDYFINKTDELILAYIQVRNHFFHHYIRQQFCLYLVGAVGTASLLLLGGYLVIHDSLSLGQLVASELILGGLIYSLKNLIGILDNYYGFVSSMDKIESIVFPPEQALDDLSSQDFFAGLDFNIELRYPKSSYLFPNQKISLLSLAYQQQASDLIDGLFGFETLSDILVTINDVEYEPSRLASLRHCSLVLSRKDFFSGTIYENLVLHHRHFSKKQIYGMLEQLKLSHKIAQFEHGIDQVIHSWTTHFTDSELARLLLIRIMTLQPKLVIINRAFDYLLDEDIQIAIDFLTHLDPVTIIILSVRCPYDHFFENHFEMQL